MTDYECPSCGGGFPESPDKQCPWCGQSIDGSCNQCVRTVRQKTVDAASRGLPDSPFDLPDTTNARGTTPCPGCGGPMPMVSWTGEKPKCRKCERKDRPKTFQTVGDMR